MCIQRSTHQLPPFVCGSNRSIGRSAARNKKGKRKKRSRLRVTSPSAARKTRISRTERHTHHLPLESQLPPTAATGRARHSAHFAPLPPLFLVTRSTPAPPRSRVVECCFSPSLLSSSVHTDATSRHATSLAAPALRVYSNYSLSPSLAFDGYFSVLTRGYFSVRTRHRAAHSRSKTLGENPANSHPRRMQSEKTEVEFETKQILVFCCFFWLFH